MSSGSSTLLKFASAESSPKRIHLDKNEVRPLEVWGQKFTEYHKVFMNLKLCF